MTNSPRSARPGWFDADAGHLIGQHCESCGSFFFPPEVEFCRNPACESESFARVPLSRAGTVWSVTINHYKPPAPAVSTDPFEPYSVAAVSLEKEGLVVLGQVSAAGPPVSIGDAVELTTEELLSDETGIQLVWRWARCEDTGVRTTDA